MTRPTALPHGKGAAGAVRRPAVPVPRGEDEDTDETDGDTVSWSQAFWRESTLTSLLEMLLGFEINKDDWRTLLTGAKARLPEILARRDAFLQAYQANAMNTITC